MNIAKFPSVNEIPIPKPTTFSQVTKKNKDKTWKSKANVDENTKIPGVPTAQKYRKKTV